MTSHELAKKLLEGPDLPVKLRVEGVIDGDWDAFWGPLESCEVKDETIRLDATIEADDED
jgi:hypothetical protein